MCAGAIDTPGDKLNASIFTFTGKKSLYTVFVFFLVHKAKNNYRFFSWVFIHLALLLALLSLTNYYHNRPLLMLKKKTSFSSSASDDSSLKTAIPIPSLICCLTWVHTQCRECRRFTKPEIAETWSFDLIVTNFL